MGKEELIDFLLRNAEVFNTHSVGMGLLRELVWLVFKLMVNITDACEKIYDVTFGLVDISTWPKVNTFIESFKPLFIALMAVSLFALGIMLMFNHEKKPKILINICVAILCVTCSTLVFSQMNQIVKDLKLGIDTVAEDTEATNVYSMVSSHFVDLYYIDQEIGLSNLDYGEYGKDIPRPVLNKAKLNVLDYTEVLDPDDDAYEFKDSNAEDILTQCIALDGDGKSYTLKENYNGIGWTSIGNKFYYRYKMDFIPVMLQLIALFFLYITLSYKCTRIAFELVFARLLAYLYSAELSGGQKIARVLTFIRDSYILLLVTTVCLKIYYMLTAYVEDLVQNPLVAAIIGVFIAFSVIDGPNLVEKLLGMDAGLQTSTSRVLTAFKVGGWFERKGAAIVRGGGRAAEKGIGYARDKMKERAENKDGIQRQGDTGSADTSFMDDKDKKQTGEKESNANPSNNAEGKAGKAGAAGMYAEDKAGRDNEPSERNHSDFASTDFMDEERYSDNQMDSGKQNGGMDTDFMDKQNAKDEKGSLGDALEPDVNAHTDTSFMDDNGIHREGSPDEGMASAEHSMDAKPESKHEDDFAKEERLYGKQNEEKRYTGKAGNRSDDRWDSMMRDKDTARNRESSLNQKSPKYKGSLFHRSFDDEKGSKK